MINTSINTSIRALVSTIRDLHGYWTFQGSGGSHRFRGVYTSYGAALAAVPRGALQGFNHRSVADFFVDTHFVFNPSDYAILFWLSRILEPGHTLFDFGGGVGQCFYIYQRFLRLPEQLRWVVCEVEALAECGERVARQKEAKGIAFTTRFDDAKDAAVLLTTGALHYVEPDLSAMLAELPRMPRHVLINRVPMYDGETYYTLQHTEHSFLPYKVMNLRAFERGMEKLDYDEVDAWYLPRSIRIPFHPKCSVPFYRGFYFRLKDKSSRRKTSVGWSRPIAVEALVCSV